MTSQQAGTLIDFETGILEWMRPRLKEAMPDITDDEILKVCRICRGSNHPTHACMKLLQFLGLRTMCDTAVPGVSPVRARGSHLLATSCLFSLYLEAQVAASQVHADAEVKLHNHSTELHKNMNQTQMLHQIWVCPQPLSIVLTSCQCFHKKDFAVPCRQGFVSLACALCAAAHRTRTSGQRSARLTPAAAVRMLGTQSCAAQ